MAKLELLGGQTSKSVRLFIQDATSPSGAGLTGLVYNTSGLVAYYIRDGAASPTAITLVTATVGTWTSGGFKEISAANMPGFYELGLPNAALAAGAQSVAFAIQGAPNMVPVPLEIELAAVARLDLTQAVPTSNTAETVGDALNAARAQGFGKWAISGTTLTLYAADGTTAVRTFTMNDAVAPTART